MVTFEHSNVSFDPSDPKDVERAHDEHNRYVENFEKKWKSYRNTWYVVGGILIAIILIMTI